MSRNFVGSRGGSGGEGGNSNPIFDRYQKRSAKKMFMDKQRGIDDSQLSSEEQYKKIFDKKLDELRMQAMKGGGGGKYKFTMPGTEESEEEEKPLSKRMEEFLARVARKKAKEEQQKQRERAGVNIKAKSFTGPQGGRIDRKGRIYGPNNTLLATVNLKTGQVRSKSGITLCKYKADSPITETKITQYIDQMSNIGGFHAGAQGHGSTFGNGTSFFGGTAQTDLYGGGGGGGGVGVGIGTESGGGMAGFYGGGSDNGGGGFWG